MICHIRLFLRINEHFYCEKKGKNEKEIFFMYFAGRKFTCRLPECEAGGIEQRK